VYISETDTAETIRLLRLSAPVKDIMNTEPEIIPAESSFDEAKELLVNSRYRGLPVFKDDNFLGVVTRRCFIEKPKKKLVLVDHNEISQSVPGAEQSDIIEIIDHHRVSPQPTKTPIYMNIRPVGSTCTIVFNHFEASGIKIDSKTGLLLLSGILSDTVILKSPTTTAVDRVAAEKLSKICGISVENYGKELLANSAVLTKTSAKDLINGDFKSYDMKGFAFGVGQVEVITFSGIEELKNTIIDELLVTCRKKNIDWAMLLITDVIKENSLLISANCIEAENKLIYKKLDENLFDLPGVLSRKKQLLPELFRVCDELR
ncbi:MAG: DHH family phosphoesterase, partial [Spirochaetales bacterium]|nr:DHH family phosphoesterase [Spirochaetales bacterium]